MKRLSCIALLALATSGALYCQAISREGPLLAAAPKAKAAGAPSPAAAAADEAETALGGAMDMAGARAIQAMTTPEYPVTPGDVYDLGFITSVGPIASTLIVDADYRVDLANLGVVAARGLRFTELRAQVERRVLSAYQLSAPRLTVKSCGTFSVFLRGEVPVAEARLAWGLSRLSELWEGVTPYASSRAVRVTGVDGVERAYDLFRAWREGDLANDPYLRPFDTVRFERMERAVSVSGAVRRPGKYQLLRGEGLRELIEAYADGFTPDANTARIELTRSDPGASGLGEKAELKWPDAQSASLEDMDAIAVPSLRELLPVAYFEGALGVGVEGAQLQAANRLPYTYYPGEKLGQAARALRGQFSAVSDLANAYLLRGEERRPVDLESILYRKDNSKDFGLEPGDLIVVPFRQFFVSVSGAVKLPGRYPYVPDRGWEYFINLAGGFDRDKNSGDKVDIFDAKGTYWTKARLIEPEDTIVAASNSFSYYLTKITPIVAVIASIISIIADTYTLTR